MDTINNVNVHNNLNNNRVPMLCSLTFSTSEFDHISTAAETFDELVYLAHAFNNARHAPCNGPSCKVVVCLEPHLV